MFNLKTDASGTGTTKQMVDTITLTPGKYSIVGMPLMPPRPDDYVSRHSATPARASAAG